MVTRIKRRTFAAALGISPAGGLMKSPGVAPASAPPRLRTDDAATQRKFDNALAYLASNVTTVKGFTDRVLIEGGGYPGVWLECAPLEGLSYRPVDARVAAANHSVFFALQRADGYLPCYVWKDKVGASQIQMVVPIIATAFELFAHTGDEAFLQQAYRSYARWDEWLVRHRDTRKLNLCEAFCGFDTGHDNSARFAGLPWECKNHDAAQLANAGNLPYLAPDLSATLFGGRQAMAAVARTLNLPKEAAAWEERAERTRKAIFKHLFDNDDKCFFDVDRNGDFVRIRGDVLTRILSEHVVDQKLFEEIWERHLHNPQRFWTPFPFPSIAIDDAAYEKTLPENSWGGPAQALTALRAPRWMEHYGKAAELGHVMSQWLHAINKAKDFHQQMDPRTGTMNTSARYSPAMVLYLEFVARLYGVFETPQTIEWNCRLPGKGKSLRYEVATKRGVAVIATTQAGSTLTLAGKRVAHVQGEGRLITDADGKLVAALGTAATTSKIEVRGAAPVGPPLRFALAANERRTL